MEQLKLDKKNSLDHLQKIQNMLMGITGLFLILFFYSIYCYITKRTMQAILLLCFLCFLTITLFNIIINDRKHYYLHYLEIIEDYHKRQEMILDSFDTGMEYSHSIALEDLNIVGNHSAFQYMNVGKSKQGKEKLIQRFENTNNDLDMIHGMIQELVQYPEWMIDFETHFRSFDFTKSLKKISVAPLKNYLLILDVILDMVTMGLVIYSFMQGLLNLALLAIGLHYAVSMIYDYLYKDYICMYSALIEIVNAMQYDSFPEFKNDKLKKIVTQYSIYTKHFKKINTAGTLYALDHNIISSIFGNAFFSLKLVLIYTINQVMDLPQLEEWVDEYTELEMLLSLAVIPVIRKDITLPEAGDHFEIQDGVFPMIPDCKSNSFNYHQTTIITGSNMSGKTSFLRMIGFNMILMNAGSYVFASKMVSPIMHVYTSINVKDDLTMGISTFYGELLRIAEANQDPKPKALLIDEIFKGTNYNDRITGAKSVIEKMNQNTMLMITTHDFELCEEENVDNYYFQEEYEDDHITFDYLIKKGKSKKTNALYLMRKLHLID